MLGPRPMTPEASHLLRSTYARLSPIGDQVAALFYARLFELEPTLRSACQGQLEQEGMHAFMLLGTLVAGADRLDHLDQVLHEYGRNFAGCAGLEERCTHVCTALLWSLEHVLGADLTPAARTAWQDFLTRLAAMVCHGAQRAAWSGRLSPAAPAPFLAVAEVSLPG